MQKLKFVKINSINSYKKKTNKVDLYFDDFKDLYFLKKTKLFFYKKHKNVYSNYRLRNKNHLNKFLNVVFKKGKKNTMFVNLNRFNEMFFNKFDDDFLTLNEFSLNLYKLILEKKFYFDLEILLPFIFSNYEFMFNIKDNKIVKNLKKLKRKPFENQLIYIKKSKRFGFLIKKIVHLIVKSKPKGFNNKFLDFIFNDLFLKEDSKLIVHKNIIYTKVAKFLKKK